MLNFLNIYSQTRKYWILLIFSAIILNSISLFIQHYFLIKPCVLCVYQRCALFGIIIAGIIAIINPAIMILRFLSVFIWLYSSFKGLLFSKQHITMILHPSPFSTCNLFVQFPQWLPLNKWLPILFDVTSGDCVMYQWYFLSLEISQWMFIVFVIYLTIALLTVLSQCASYIKKC